MRERSGCGLWTAVPLMPGAPRVVCLCGGHARFTLRVDTRLVSVVCASCAVRDPPVLCSSIHVVSHVRLSHLKRSLSRKVQFPPPHVSNWPLSPCTMLYGRLQTRNPLYALAKVRSGVVIILHLHAKRAPRRTAHLVSKPTDVWRQLFTYAGSSARRLSC